MRFLPLLLAASAVSVTAQSPLTTTFVNNNGNGVGGMVFFDLDVTDPAGIQVFALDLNTGVTAGAIDVYTAPTTWVGNESNAAAWTLAGSGAFASGAGAGLPTQVCMGAGFYLPQGQYGLAIAQDATTSQLYTTGTAPFQLIYSTAELSFTAGGSNNVHFGGAPFNPRVWNGNIHYNLGPVAGACLSAATKQVYGGGCNAAFASFYEQMDTASFDLTDTDLSATNTGAGYVVLLSPGTGSLPVGGVDPAGGTVVTLGDDNQVPVGTLGMTVGSNGWFAVGAGNSNAFSPSVGAMLGNPSEAVYTWTDLQPNVSGVVTYEEDIASGLTRVTYDGVFGWNTTDPVDIQIDYNVTTGDWAIRYGVVGFNNPEDWIVGYSPAGANADPGATDISASAAILVEGADLLPLSIDSNTPRLGTNWDITTSKIDAVSPYAVTFFGDRGPPVPMLQQGHDAPGCDIHLAVIHDDRTAPLVADTMMVSIPVPNNAALAGLLLSAQSACFTLSNGVNVLTSNGVEGMVGM